MLRWVMWVLGRAWGRAVIRVKVVRVARRRVKRWVDCIVMVLVGAGGKHRLDIECQRLGLSEGDRGLGGALNIRA